MGEGGPEMAAKKRNTKRAKASDERKPTRQSTRTREKSEELRSASADAVPVEGELKRSRPSVARIGRRPDRSKATAKEELQSLNGELKTVNNQLQEKVEELEKANNDMANLLQCTDIPTIFLDADFRIKLFTPASTKLFNLIASDIGRPIGDITPRFSDPELLGDARQVLRQLAPREKEISITDGFWWSRRIMPYRTRDNRIDGVVITFVDITDRKKAGDVVVQRLAAIVESSTDAVFSKDLDGTIRTWNRGAERVYGHTAGEAIGHSVGMLIPEDRANEFVAIMNQLRRGENIDRMETERVHKDGRRLPVELTISPVREGSGKVVSAAVISRDISERKRAEAALRESERPFRLLADTAPVMIWMSGTDKLCTWCNKPWLDFVGRPMERELGNGWTENIHADDFDGCLKTYTRAFDARKPFSMEYRLKRHDGEYRWLLDNGVPLYGSDGGFSGYIGSCIDITDRREAEQSAAETYRHLKLAMSAGRMAAWTWDPHKDVVSTSENFQEICGVSSIDSREQGASLLHPEDRSRHREIVDYAVKHGTPYQSVARMIRPDNGQVIWLDLRAVPVTDSEGHVTTLSGVAIDITERKGAEEALRHSEAESRRLLDFLQAVMANMGEGLYTSDAQGRVTYMNPAAESLLGWKSAELLGRRMHDLTHYKHPDGRPFPIEECAGFRVLDEGKALKDHDDVFIRRDGSFFPVVYSCAPLVSGRKVAGLVVVFRDVTDRKQAEARLRESEARMQAVLNTAADAIITMNIHGVIQSVNPASERMFGYVATEMVGHNVGLLMPSPYREEHDRYLERYLQTGVRHIIGIGRELKARRKDGSIFPIHLVVSEIEDRELFTGILRDMTELKRMEREVVEVASQQQQRIAQDLHDSVAQEMTALTLLARDLAETLETDPANAPKLVERIEKGLQRSQTELRAVLQGLLPVAVDRGGLMAALADLASRIQQHAKVTCTFDCPEPIALTDNLTATHLFLIAQEAVHNAVKHGKPRNIWIGLQSNHALVLRVQCNGMGMPARPSATEGLGLRIMRDRAAIIGAHLTIESAEPTGTVVTCSLVRRNNEREKEETSPSPDRR
jgi:PAS domain S-box-containing protein